MFLKFAKTIPAYWFLKFLQCRIQLSSCSLSMISLALRLFLNGLLSLSNFHIACPMFGENFLSMESATRWFGQQRRWCGKKFHRQCRPTHGFRQIFKSERKKVNSKWVLRLFWLLKQRLKKQWNDASVEDEAMVLEVEHQAECTSFAYRSSLSLEKTVRLGADWPVRRTHVAW